MTARKDDGSSKHVKSESEEMRDKGRDQRRLGELSSSPDDGTSNHPEAEETGFKGASNVGDETSGDG